MTIDRLLLATATSSNWNLIHLYVNNAFSHGDLDEEVYMTPPPVFLQFVPDQVCKLHNSMYGLKQAIRQWFEKLSSLLLSFHYKQSQADRSVFTKLHDQKLIILLIYVDYLVISGNDLDEI